MVNDLKLQIDDELTQPITFNSSNKIHLLAVYDGIAHFQGNEEDNQREVNRKKEKKKRRVTTVAISEKLSFLLAGAEQL